MDIQGTTARLRRTFQYPTDESSSGTPEVLDEEEQETLIQDLAHQNAARNLQFQRVLLALPTLAAIPFLIALFRPSTSLISILGLTSLGSTAYLLYTLPPASTGIPFLDRLSTGSAVSPSSNNPTAAHTDPSSTSSSSSTSTPPAPRARPRASSFSFVERKSPLEQYLPYLNLGLCVVLVLTGMVVRRSDAARFGLLGLGNLPAIVYAVVLLAKVVMAGVDPERELGGLRYEYKGA